MYDTCCYLNITTISHHAQLDRQRPWQIQRGDEDVKSCSFDASQVEYEPYEVTLEICV